MSDRFLQPDRVDWFVKVSGYAEGAAPMVIGNGRVQLRRVIELEPLFSPQAVFPLQSRFPIGFKPIVANDYNIISVFIQVMISCFCKVLVLFCISFSCNQNSFMSSAMAPFLMLCACLRRSWRHNGGGWCSRRRGLAHQRPDRCRRFPDKDSFRRCCAAYGD